MIEATRRRILAPVRDALEFLLPQRCPSCGEPAEPIRVLCSACLQAIPRANLEVCCRCLLSERDPAGCSRHPGFRVLAAWLYDERAAALIAAYKYEGRPASASFLASILAEAAGAERPDLVIGVPMHSTRRRERGFDHAGALARAFAIQAGVPAIEGLLVRLRAVAPQAQQSPYQRRRAVRGSIGVPHPSWIRGRRIIVVDDVITTGATFEATLSALEAAGARASGLALAWAQ
jgi:ComF family protein